MSSLFVPALMLYAVLYALHKGIDVFAVFLRGAEQGMRTAVRLLPTLLALLTAVQMLRASGAVDVASAALYPLCSRIGIPSECTTLVLLKPFSGSGGLALGREIMCSCGVDSVAGKTAAVMLGASETSFYTIGIYTGHLSLKHTRWLIPAAIAADVAAYLSASLLVNVFG